MRKLMYFTIGFALACGAGVYLLQDFWYIVLGVFCLMAGLGALLLCGRPSKAIAAGLLGCVAGFAWLWCFDVLYLAPARENDAQDCQLTVTATDYSFPTAFGCAFDGYCQLDGKRYPLRCYLDQAQSILPGTVLEGDFRLRYTADGGKLEPTYHQSKGIFLLVYENEIFHESVQDPRIWDYPAIWRQTLIGKINTLFPADTAAFANALLLGHTSDFTYEQERNFQVTGLRHVVAVSGLHVSILFSMLYLFFGRNRLMNAVLGIPLLAVFAAVAGFTPSITRACVMQALMLLAMLADQEYDPPTALSFAALVILICNPRAITAVGFQLSAGCMIGIFAFSQRLQQYFLSFGKLKEKSKGKSPKAKLIRWFTGSVAATFSAMTVTTPLCAIYFGMVSLVGVISNLLTLWVITFIFYGIILACVFSWIWLPLGKGIAWLAAWLIRYVQGASHLLAKFPLAAVYTDSVYIIFWLAMSYCLVVIFLLQKKKRPGLLAGGILGLLLVAVGLSWLEPRLDDTRFTMLDVGQGQCLLLQQEQQIYMVDCGGGYSDSTADQVTNYLYSQGIFRLDGLILTHYDADHAGSIPFLLKNVPADRLYLPDHWDSNGIRQEIISSFTGEIQLVQDQQCIPIPGGQINLYPAENPVNDNESSMCVLFQAGNCDILITGDRSASGERQLLQQAQLPLIDIFVVGHHGSHNATTHELLAQTWPTYALISVGADNPYGHPRQQTLDRLTLYGCRILRTDHAGNITFRR